MKIITLKKEDFDKYASTHKYNSYFQSSNYADFAQKNDQYNVHYMGFFDENSKRIVGAALMLYKTLFWGYKYAYSPRGLLIDYDDPDLISETTKQLKRLLKKQKFIFVKVDPLVVASERDKDGKIIKFNDKVNGLLSFLKKNDYEHLGFNIYNESTIPRWNVFARLNKDGRLIYNNFSQDVKEKLNYADNIGMEVSIDNEADIDKFVDFVKKSNSKINKRRLQNLRDAFINNQKIKIFYAKLNTKKYVEKVNNLYSNEETKNIALANIIQSGDNYKYNISKAINDKIVSDKKLHMYKKDIVSSTQFLKKYPDGLICGAAITIEEIRGVNIEINYVDSNNARYNPDALLIYEIMKYYGKMDYKYINIGPITGNFDPTSKYYSMLEKKLGFNSSILEYIGEFNIIINPTMYRIYKKKYANKK